MVTTPGHVPWKARSKVTRTGRDSRRTTGDEAATASGPVGIPQSDEALLNMRAGENPPRTLCLRCGEFFVPCRAARVDDHTLIAAASTGTHDPEQYVLFELASKKRSGRP